MTSARDGTLSAIDSETLRGDRADRPRAGCRPGSTIGAGSVWVSNPRTGNVLRIDSGGQVIARVEVGGRPGAVAFGGGRLWVADEDGAGITAIDAETNRPVGAGHRASRGAAATRRRRRRGLGEQRLHRDRSPHRPRRTPCRARRSGSAAGRPGSPSAADSVWVANSRSGTVTRVDPSLRAILGDPIPVGARPGGIDAGTSTVWVANAAEATVSRIDIGSGEIVGDPIGVASDPGAVAVGASAVWVASNDDGTVTRIEP